MNVKELYNESVTADIPLLYLSTTSAAFPFLSEYASNYKKLDKNFVLQYLTFEPRTVLGQDTLADFQMQCESLLYKYRDKYTRMWELVNVTYDPIANYDRDELITKTYEGSESDTQSLGKSESTIENSVTAGDSDIYADSDKSHSTSEAVTNTNTHAYADRVDTEHNVTKGNIGITSTQQMIQQSVDLYNIFNFYNILFKDIANEVLKVGDYE